MTAAAGAAKAPTPPSPSVAEAQTQVSVAILRDFYETEIRPLLHRTASRQLLQDRVSAQNAFHILRTVTPASVHEAVTAFEDIWEEARELNRQQRLHDLLHGWLLVHVPLSYALLLLTAVHAVQALRY